MRTDYKIAVGIDLGTHGTGFAWCEIPSLHRSAASRDIYYYDRWRGDLVACYKNLSAICIDPSGNVAACGFEARRLWMERLQDDNVAGWG